MVCGFQLLKRIWLKERGKSKLQHNLNDQIVPWFCFMSYLFPGFLAAYQSPWPHCVKIEIYKKVNKTG